VPPKDLKLVSSIRLMWTIC